MSKKLVHNYTFDPANNTIVISYIYSRERFLLITNTTDNATIYQFNDSSLGFSSITHDYDAETTTLVLTYDCSAMSSTDSLQIFVEVDEQRFEPSETFVDPVSKFRVSQPENLIDTDFEYGLQSTKWETLEMVKNIPTFFTRFGDDYFPVTAMSTTANSDVVTVVTQTEHNLIAGVPLIVKGTKRITTDGTFIVTSTPNTTVFTYKSKALATTSESIFDSIATQVYSGQRYQGTEFSLDGISTITTSGQPTSNLNVNTLYPTNFLPNTSFYLTNSVGSKTLTVNTAAIIANSYSEISSSLSAASATPVVPSGGSYSGWFDPRTLTSYFGEFSFALNEVSIVGGNTLVFSSPHELIDNYCYMWSPGEGNTLSGLTENFAYHVRVLNSTTIYFTPGQSQTTRLSLSGITFAGVHRSKLIRVHRVININTASGSTGEYVDINDIIPISPNYKIYFFPQGNSWTGVSQVTGVKHGEWTNVSYWMGQNSFVGGGFTRIRPSGFGYLNSTTINFTSTSAIGGFVMFVANTVTITNTPILTRNTITFANTPTFTNGSTLLTIFSGGAVPGGLSNNTNYALQRYAGNTYRIVSSTDGSERFVTSYGSNTTSVTFSSRSPSTTGDTIYAPDHGLNSGTPVRFTTADGGTAPGGLSNNTTYYVFDATKDTFKLTSNTTQWLTDSISILSSGTTVAAANDTITLPTNAATNGAAVYYEASGGVIGGLVSGGWFWVNKPTATHHKLYYTKSDAIAGGSTNLVDITSSGSGTQIFRFANLLDITSPGTGNGIFTVTAAAGGSDGVYKLTNSSNSTNFTLFSNYNIPERVLQITANSINIANNAARIDVHGFTQYTPVTYVSNGTGTEIQGLTNNSVYYISRLSQNWVRFANTIDDVTTGNTITINVPVTPAGGQHYLVTSSVSGEVQGPGTINVSSSCTVITGVGTKFASSFAPGDEFKIFNNSSGQGNVVSERIKYINSDEQIVLANTVNLTANNLTYAVGTGLFVRADGQAIHRPYDGGVELTPSLNPDGNMIRQTRKYFRYQSGKGIQVSFAVNFKPTTTMDDINYSIEDVAGTNTAVATVTTRYPHRLTSNLSIVVTGAANSIAANGESYNYWNGNTTVYSVVDDYTFKYVLNDTPPAPTPSGLVEYYVDSWLNSETRCGLFDDQNGLYFEFNGQTLSCCRKSSTTQISGTVSVEYKSSRVVGTNTKFVSQLSVGSDIVIKGQTYRITQIDSDFVLYILPSYRGVTASGCIVTKTEVLKVPQSEWNIDKCDGTGPSGFYLNLARIQMAYMDYSWYGAGKVRFGFKNQEGQVIYVHEFIHNNKQREAYMRSGNLPARYQIENIGQPTHVPALAHWGTSVIMDGRFDDDKAYVFNAASPQISISGGSVLYFNTTTTNGVWYVSTGGQYRTAGYALTVSNAAANSTLLALTPGVAVGLHTGVNAGTLVANPFDNRISPYLPYLSGVTARFGSTNNVASTGIYNLIIVDRLPSSITTANTSFTLSSAGTTVVYEQPLISIRLAPSVDNGAAAQLGAREIINRMQLVLAQVGILSTHNVEVNLRLNSKLTNYSWTRVSNPSLSQLIYHNAADRVEGGSIVYSFRAQGGTGSPRSSVLTTQDLGDIATLGNSIMGGDSAFPDGPDILTVTVRLVEDSSSVTGANPLTVTGRIGWTESQA